MREYELSNEDIIKMVKRLHHDNERDTVAGLRENCAECIVLRRIHERNNIINMLLKRAKL
jgi:hypothetical protein